MVKLSPIPIIISFLAVMSIIIFIGNPIYIATTLVYVAGMLYTLRDRRSLKKSFIQGLYFIAIAVTINLFMSSNGKTLLFRTSRIGFIGRLDISVEEVAFSLVSSMKIISLFMLMNAYSAIMDFDQLFYLLSKCFSKFSLTISIIYNMIFKMRSDMTRIQGVLKTRGVDFEERNIIKRSKNYYFLIKILLISSLEGSIDYAQSLYSRNYRSGKRTSYKDFDYGFKDALITAIDAALIGFMLVSIKTDTLGYQFYPRLDKFEIMDIYMGGILLTILFCKAVLLRHYTGGAKSEYIRN